MADELLKYGVLEEERLKLTGPDVALTPRVGQVFALAIHELAINAVEHGRLGAPEARFEVAWSVADRASHVSMRFTWTENSGTVDGAPAHRGFGTEVLRLMLPYELRADTRLTFGADELRYVIDIPDLSGLGRVVTDRDGA